MSLEFTCPGCAKPFRVADDLAGRKGKCPRCERVFDIPRPPEDTGIRLQPAAAVPPLPPLPPPVDAAPGAEESARAPRRKKAKKTKRPALLAVGAGLLVLLAAGGVGLALWKGPVLARLGLGASGPEADWTYLPDDCRGLTVLNVERLLASPTYRRLKDEAGRHGFDLEKPIAEQGPGLPPATVRRLTLGWAGDPDSAVAVVTTKKVMTAEDVRALLAAHPAGRGREVRSSKVGRSTLSEAGIAAVGQAGDKTLVCGRPESVRRVLERGRRPAFSNTLKSAVGKLDLERDAVASALETRTIREGPFLSGPALALAAAGPRFGQVEVLLFQLNLDSNVNLKLTFQCRDAVGADSMKQDLHDGLTVFRLAVRKRHELPQSLLQLVEAVTVNAAGPEVVIGVATDAETLIGVTKDLAGQPGLVPPGLPLWR